MDERVQADGMAVRMLAKVADLPLAVEREKLLAPQLGVWLAAANELNRKMSQPDYCEVTPVAVFTHPRA